jgi:hypothetical protein
VVNTLRVGEAWVTPALLEELRAREGKDIEVLEGGLTAFAADSGDLMPFDGSALPSSSESSLTHSPKRQKKASR